MPSGKYKTNIELNQFKFKAFDKEISKYSYMYKTGGEFSKNIKN